MYNKVMLIGRLGQDPEMRYTANGLAICKFNIATSEKWNDKATGVKKEKTEWHRITAFGKLADICIEYIAKGSKVFIEGKIQTQTYEKEGQRHYVTEIIVINVQFLDNKNNNISSNIDASNSYPLPSPSPSFKETPPMIDDDIPF